MIPTNTPTPAPTALVSIAPSMIVPVALLRSGTDRTNFQDATNTFRAPTWWGGSGFLWQSIRSRDDHRFGIATLERRRPPPKGLHRTAHQQYPQVAERLLTKNPGSL